MACRLLDSVMKSARIAFIGLLMLVLGLLIVKAAQQGLSDFYALLAQQEIDRGAGSNAQDKDPQWLRTQGYLAEALRYSPRSAWPLEQTTVLQVRRMQAATDNTQRIAAALAAQLGIRALLPERPTLSLSWANLALAKYTMGETGRELAAALANAQELGPWEHNTQIAVIVIGLYVWQHLGPAQQAQLLGTLERAARRNIENMAQITKSLKRLDLFCDINYVRLAAIKACMKSASQ